MQPDTRLEIPAHVMARELSGETVLLDLVKASYFSLNGVGSRVWTLIGQGMALNEVCQTLLTEYDVPAAQLEQDVTALAQTLLDKQLVQVAA